MNILVTGGAGFIGSNLCDYLVSKNYHVTIIDDLSTGKTSNLSSIIETIIFFKEKIESFDFNKLNKIDIVVHLAAQPSVPISIENFGISSSMNILGSINVIDYCRTHKIPLVYASSSAIYGDLEIGDDQGSEIDLLSPYATDKYAMELYAKTAYRLYQLSSIGLRFFNVYGPRQDPSSPYSGVISIFIDRLLNGHNIRINGGFQTRDFVYIEDIIQAIFKSIHIVCEDIICDQVNVLTGKTISVDEVSDILIKEIGIKVDKEFYELPEGDPKKSDGTSTKMKEFFGHDLKNMISIKTGLVKTVNFMQDSLRNNE
jgi:UDP-glucose 4-epimerase